MPTAKKTSSRTAKSSPKKKSSSSALTFPSVSTHLASGRSNNTYDQLGVPFKFPTGSGIMDLQNFFGAAATGQVTGSGQIIFHMMGDSGVGPSNQEEVANAMALDINNTNHELGPSFMVHLGDVMYNPNKLADYADRFYRVYDQYDRLIFAIPGNHDGEVLPSTDPVTLAAFQENFCAAATDR